MIDCIILEGEGLDSPIWERAGQGGHDCSSGKSAIIMSTREVVQLYEMCNKDDTDPEICKSCVLRDDRWNGAWVTDDEAESCWSLFP